MKLPTPFYCVEAGRLGRCGSPTLARFGEGQVRRGTTSPLCSQYLVWSNDRWLNLTEWVGSGERLSNLGSVMTTLGSYSHSHYVAILASPY